VVVRKEDAKTRAVKKTVDKVAIATRGRGQMKLGTLARYRGGEPGLVARPTILVRANR